MQVERRDAKQAEYGFSTVPVALLSLIGIIALWYSMSPMVGIAFTISVFIAMILVRVS